MITAILEDFFFIGDRERNTRVAGQLGIPTHVVRDLWTLVADLQAQGFVQG